MSDITYDVAPRLLVVMVTHNGTPWLTDSLMSLDAQLYSGLDLVVVDNGSDEPVDAMVARFAPGAELVRLKRNLGFGAACNAGLEASAKTAEADYFLFLHDDVALEQEACGLAVAAAIETGAGIIGGKGLGWSHPEVLVEFGMSADQFCLPYSRLEEGEIDQGQYEKSEETLYVSSACLLVSRAVAKRCGLWDGAYFALGEDLDLCIRARIAGFKVMVVPAVRFRHDQALVSGLREVRRMPPLGMLARRNQLRTIAKNASLPRMLISLSGCVLLGAIKVVILLLLRRFGDVRDYPRAFVGFVKAFPNIMLRRRAIQKRRTVPDRKVMRFMIKDSRRMRVQLERRLRLWEAGTVALGARTLSQLSLRSLRQRTRAWLRQPSTISIGVIILLLAVAMRQTLFGGAVASGSLWPFPAGPGRLLTDYVSGWRSTGLGTESAAPAAFPILWGVSLLGLGSPVFAQKLLLVGLMAIGLLGIGRLVGKTTSSRPALVLTVGIYALGPVVQAMVSGADLGALALYAGMPFILSIVLGALTPPAGKTSLQQQPAPGPDWVRPAARIALIGLPVVALGPSNLVTLIFVLTFVCIYHLVSCRAMGGWWIRVRAVGFSVPLLILVLIPWSLEALRPAGAILSPLFSGAAGAFYPLWSRYSLGDMLLLNPDGGPAALVVPALTLGALLLASSPRRAESRLLAGTLLAFSVVGGLAGKGLIPPPVASPAMWLVVPLSLVSLMAGHLVAGIKEELPRHAFGWRHKIAIPAIGLTVGAGVLLGWAPQLAGWSKPVPTFAAGTSGFSLSIASFLKSTADGVGEFRVLWLGNRWVDPVRAGLPARTGSGYFLTGAGGLTVLDGFQAPPATGENRIQDLVDALMDNRLHLAGHLLAPAGVRFVIVDAGDRPAMRALSRQRDIALEQQQSGVVIFRNLQWLPRASLAPANLVKAVTAQPFNEADLMLTQWSGGRSIPSRSPNTFSAELPRTVHSQVLVGDNFNAGWRAKVNGRRLVQGKAFGWANRFSLPAGARGKVEVYYGADWIRFLWLLGQVLILLALVNMARPVAAKGPSTNSPDVSPAG